MLTKQLRMKRNTQFTYVFKKGNAFKGKHLMIIVAPKKYKLPKIGLVVTKKIGKSVVRNHVKRLIRESIRNYVPQLSHHFLNSFTSIYWNFLSIYIASNNIFSY